MSDERAMQDAVLRKEWPGDVREAYPPAPQNPHMEALWHLENLGRLMSLMEFPDGRGGIITAEQPLRQLFDAARTTIYQHKKWADIAAEQ